MNRMIAIIDRASSAKKCRSASKANSFFVRQKKNSFLLTLNQIRIATQMSSSSSHPPPAPTVDPYQLFGLQKSFSVEELRRKYKTLAMQVHPDKTGGSDYLFKECYSAYKFLLKEFEKRQIDKPFNELREQSRSYVDRQRTDEGSRRAVVANMTSASTKSSGSGGGGGNGRFNVARFNRVFDEARLDNPVDDHGYGEWMSPSTKNRDDIDVRNFVGEYSQDRFNNAFDKKVPVSKQQSQALIRKTNAPQCVSLGSRQGAQFCELGVSKITDFGDKLTNKGISYADYKRAHTTERLVDPALLAAAEEMSKRPLPAAMKQMEADRERISYMMSDRDRHVYERRRIKEERQEAERAEYMLRQDALIEKTFHKFNRLLMGGS